MKNHELITWLTCGNLCPFAKRAPHAVRIYFGLFPDHRRELEYVRNKRSKLIM